MERSPELVQVVQRYVDAFLRGDAETMLNLHAPPPGLLVIGTDPAEWLRDEEVGPVYRTQLAEFQPTAARLLVAEAWVNGATGWAATEVEFDHPEGQQQFRITFVFVLELGIWRIVQSHASVGVANEEVIGLSLTTSVDALVETVLEDPPDVVWSIGAGGGTVTVLFSDIESSTQLAEELGDDRWVTELRQYDACVRDVVAKGGGTVIKGMGDGYMATFPSAGAGVRTALRLQEVLPKHLPTRIGLNAGDAVRTPDDFFGHTVTVAARIASAASGSEVLVSNLVRELLRGARDVEFTDERFVELKGIPTLVTVHRAIPASTA